MSRLFPSTHYNLRETDAQREIIQSWQSDSIDLKVPVVCRQCNNGWMSDLECDDAQPAMKAIIRSLSPQRLSERQILSIAVFAFKTAVIVDHMHIRGRRFFSIPLRRRFAASLEIPSGTYMWLAPFAGPVGVQGILRARYYDGEIGGHDGLEFYVLTYSMGSMAFQVLSWTHTGNYHLREVIRPVFKQASFAETAIPIWPNRGVPALWPPDHHLDEQSINEFCNRWREMGAERA
jgi:hypothetical protein